MKSLYVFLISVAFSSVVFAADNAGDDPKDGVVVPAQLEQNIRVESAVINGKDVEVLHLPDGQKIEIPVDLNSAEIIASGLSSEDVAIAREAAREQLELTLQAVYSDDFNGAMFVNAEGQAASLEPAKLSLRKRSANFLKKIYQEDKSLLQPLPEGAGAISRTTRFVRYAYQFVFAETIRAFISYGRDWWRAKSRLVEYGFSIDFKFEPQVFIAKFNPTNKYRALRRNYEFIYDISYNFSSHSLVVHRRLRREKGTGGLGMPAFKTEIKTYQSDGTNRPIRGKSWYPIAPPIASFVLDSSEHYFAQGVSIGVNSGELIPGSTLTNTFTEFAQGTRVVTLESSQQDSTALLKRAADAFRNILNRFRQTCSALLEPDSRL